MSSLTKYRGFGGGGDTSGGSSAHEASDSLRSRQTARILDLISEGECEGLVNGLKDVYLDGTPVQNADGSFNFSGVTFETRNGTQAQSYIPGFGAVENEVAVSTQVKTTQSVTRTISSVNVDAVRVTVFVPRLMFSDDKGNLIGTSVNISIFRQTNNGGFVEVVNDTITGKTTAKYQRSYRIELPGTGPWNIRVNRNTPDSTDSKLSNDTWWGSYTEIIDAKLRYPNSALAAITFDSQQFSSIPSRAYKWRGIKCKVPWNYDPILRTYVGAWDGTFVTKWTNNPAWIFYDLMTSPRYGLGTLLDASLVDKWTLYQISKYCDELVSDGFGGMEPRYTCNLFIQTREEALKVVKNLASVFQGTVYWGSGGVIPVADMPSDPVMLFTNANVIDGIFQYQGTDKTTRHTVALVTYNDPDNLGKQAIEYVEDLNGIALYGINETEVTAFGCDRRGQAYRLGRAMLNAEINDTETISFRCGYDGTYLAPGAVFAVGDRYRSGARLSGRVVSEAAVTTTTTQSRSVSSVGEFGSAEYAVAESVTSTTTGSSGVTKTSTPSKIYIDAPVTLENGKIYTLACVLPSGTVESRAVLNVPGATDTLDVEAFSQAPQDMAQWVLSTDTKGRELWKVVSAKEVTPDTIEVQGLAYRPEKYAEIESGITLQPKVSTSLFGIPSVPTNIVVSEGLYQIGADIKTEVVVSWDGVPGVFWEVLWRNNEDNWQNSGRILVPTLTLRDVNNGSLEIRVIASTVLGMRSDAATATKIIVGKTAPPMAVSGFYVTKVGGLGVAEWAIHPDLDVRVGGKIFVRHAQETVNATWSNAVIVAIYDGNTTTGNLALMTGTYMAKARDSSGNWSETAVAFVVTEGMAQTYTTQWSITESPLFSNAPGASDSNVEVNTGNLRITSGNLTGHHWFGWHDFGSVATRRFEGDVGILGYYENDAIDVRGNIDDWSDIDGGTVNDGDATLYIQTSNDGITLSEPTPFFVADFTCRYAQFRINLERGSVSTNVAINLLRVDVKVPV